MVGIGRIRFFVILLLPLMFSACKRDDLDDIARYFYKNEERYNTIVQYIEDTYIQDIKYREAENISFADCSVRHSRAYSQVYDDFLCSEMKSLDIKEISVSAGFSCPNRRMKEISFLLKDNVRSFSYQIIYDFCPYELKDYESGSVKIKKINCNYYIFRAN